MNPELKGRWTAKLRSGDYLQGKGALRKRGEERDLFCCLGVLCEIAVEDGEVVRSETPEVIGWNYRYAEEGALLPIELEGWSGIASYDDRRKLMDLNDSKGKTFAEIADWIDANL
jgi:hypothetical protein